jgi:hypothetical protein
MQLPERVALGTTFLVERPLGGLVQALEAAFVAQEVDAIRDGPYVFLCRALREHQIVLLEVGIFNQSGKILVSMRRGAGDRQQAVLLANELGAAAGLRGPVVASPKLMYDPDVHDAARYLGLLGGDFKAVMEGLCAAATMRAALKTGKGRELAERVAQIGESAEPLLRLTALSVARVLVREGADPRLFEAAARTGLADKDALVNIQSIQLLSFL